ncbi:MAG: low specificity L-threonine aldolase [Sphingobacteriales bacterium]|nr:MAG: low specificity L-threonine aldolase [Sphingobacteriales bacterium]
MKSFASDNYAGVLPEVMEALHKANTDHARSYGVDDTTDRVRKLFNDVFEQEVDVYFVFNGTGANVLSISSATQSYNSVLCADISHFYNDESSAPETFTGCRFFPLPTNDKGKLETEPVKERLIRKGDVHYAQTQILSLTQSTEYGTVYTAEEIKELTETAKDYGLYLHMDGSRFFNAAASLNCSLADISCKAGIDILSLGGTKAGMMFGEAVVVFNKELSKHIVYKQKQSMQLASKTRFISAQFEAMLQNEAWRQHASHSNTMAQSLAKMLSKYTQIKVTKPVMANAVFAELPVAWTTQLQEQYPFYIWKDATNEARLMCSFDTSIDDINGFERAINTLV